MWFKFGAKGPKFVEKKGKRIQSDGLEKLAGEYDLKKLQKNNILDTLLCRAITVNTIQLNIVKLLARSS